MVKLFVGNLGEAVDSHRLKNLFLQYGLNVQECDVLKNFAFVHVATEDDASVAIEKLDKTILEGREIHIERSTSRLRKEPGMSDKCFTCGAQDHKTPNCPDEMNRRKNMKRAGEDNDSGSAKRASTVTTAAPSGGSCWGYKLPTVVDNDPELPCPQNPELKTLYDQYKDARSRYQYFRDRLQKELSLQAANGIPVGSNGPVRIDLTRTVQPPQPIVSSISAAPAPTSMAQPTPAYGGSGTYRPQNYPGAGAPASASYPGAQASVYSAQPSSVAYGQQASQHYSTPYQSNKGGDSMKGYSNSPSTYQRSQNYPSYN